MTVRFPRWINRWPLALITACNSPDMAANAVDASTTAAPSSTGGDSPTSGAPTETGDDGSEHPTTGGSSTTGSVGPGDSCGDGLLDPDEDCDDGPLNDAYAACTDACRRNVCGDGKVYVGVEGCDEGPANVDTGYCRSDCQLGVCGDGFVFAALEQCDAGEANGPGYGQCDEQCTVNRCGDGELDVGHEECDAGEDNGSGRDGEGGLAGCDLECGFAGRRIFLSSQSFTGEMGTRAGADVACQAMAGAAGFERSDRYRALLADADGAPNTFVEPIGEGLPFILPTGQIVAASYPALIKVGPGAGITTTEKGEVVFDLKVWTNVNPAGDAYLKEPAST